MINRTAEVVGPYQNDHHRDPGLRLTINNIALPIIQLFNTLIFSLILISTKRNADKLRDIKPQSCTRVNKIIKLNILSIIENYRVLFSFTLTFPTTINPTYM